MRKTFIQQIVKDNVELMEKDCAFIDYTNGKPKPNMAKKLLEKSQKSFEVAYFCYQEGYPNNGISRSYYSVYQLLMTVLVGNGDYDKNSEKHKKVIDDFNEKYGKKSMFNDYADFFKTKISNSDKEEDLSNSKTMLLLEKKRISLSSHITILRFLRKESDYEPTHSNLNNARDSLYLATILIEYIKKIFKESEDYKENFGGIF